MLASQGVKKSQAEKALDALADKGSIVRKEFGKTKIYFPSQEGLAELEPEEKAAKLEEIRSLAEQVKKMDVDVAALRKEVTASSASLSVEQLQEKFTSLQERSEILNKKLASHRSGAGPKISASDVSAAETKLQRMLDVWSKRRRTFMNLWSEMSENIEGKQADIFEDIGVDTDEAVGETLEMYRKLLASNKKGKV
ncbi:putative Homologous-pairing protein 2-like protein [Nannochloris sp. 'desiccata']|nr:hypothetical protein KSW81_005835 [Chlorella desiccata (nom. nud.)]KAH7623251.1 putative Homologous-pairing protein 2-like protein [Chlorella desiccata (nom. nud.)]